ncbi:type II and III secretion system protein family protein [Fulvimarina sp. 2208YS6-2-32]|uniref:Type II and III secretion system protein family protein n=1 Tax=Fulvimarina uroteuthidis TaxID=3098149 RepID=A0ABU5I0F3_9HYPH|nr:type II and III secretion system protein family protein [Fulvimarina sp. 2208YS6-2-32]MDY8108453.1 type II and III secretion system protein family protein [Fulvimarina sp. 2208YS6-2-32]
MSIIAILRAVSLSATLVVTPFAGVAPANAQSPGQESIVNVGFGQTRIDLGLDKSKVLVLSADAHDILVANPAIADALTRDKRHIYLFGKQVGQTNLIVFDEANRQIASIDIRIERDIKGLTAAIEKYVPDSEVVAEIMNDNVVLTGRVRTPLDSKRVSQIADAYLSGGEATTGAYIRSASAGGEAEGGGDVAFASEPRRSSKVINLLQIEGEDQVTLKVTVAEVQRSVVKQLGLNGTVGTVIDGMTFGAISDSPFGLGKALSNSGALLNGTIGDTGISAQLSALEQAGVMRTLAEPSLTAISGESASFKVGGEFSVPTGRDVTPEKITNIRDDNGNIVDQEVTEGVVTIDSRQIEYGIGLDFTPVVLSPGRISLKIRTSVSEPSFESPFSYPGDKYGAGVGTIGLRKRLADTTVELPSGGSLVIAGLVRDEVRQVVSGFPGLSKLPILGSLFRSRDFQRYETELVVIVTPYLVRPVSREALARPDDGLAFSSDGAANFLGRVNRIYGHSETKLPPGRYHGVVGYIYK